jgi:predicted nucleic acid-binding protein
MIVIDTGPLVALCDSRDAKHRLAVRQLETLAANPFGTCDAVLTEACFHLPYRSQRQRLSALMRELGVEAVPADRDVGFWSDTLEWLERYAEHEPDWADASLAVLSGRDRRIRIWTYDREFRTTWRRSNGTAIPLALKE